MAPFQDFINKMVQNNRTLLIGLFKAAVFLFLGTTIGFFLGMAYASHLYGPHPVVREIQGWLAGDNLYEGPLPVDLQGNLMASPLSIIPKMGACIGFFLAASILSSSVWLKILVNIVNKMPAPEPGESLNDPAGSAGTSADQPDPDSNSSRSK